MMYFSGKHQSVSVNDITEKANCHIFKLEREC